MKNLPSVLAAGALFVVLLLYMCSFQVRTTEVAIEKTFGEADAASVITEPGLNWKWPWPIQSVVKYDKRLRILEDQTEETRTADSKNIILTTYTVWTIADPYEFHRNYRSEEEGARALKTKIRSHKLAVAGKHTFSEFVSTNPAERHLDQIEDEMKMLVQAEALDEFGVDVKLFGIKQLVLPEEVTNAVFENMKKHEETTAKKYEAEGEAKAAEIRARAQAQQQRIMAVAKRKVDGIQNEAQAKVSEIWKAFDKHPELRAYLDKLEALEHVLRERTTLIFDTKIPPIDLFNDEMRIEAARGQARLAVPDVESLDQAARASAP